MPRFVLLHHVLPTSAPRPSHCDLMFETGNVLRTWCVTALPRDWALAETTEYVDFDTTNDVPAVDLAAHRLAYLDYEGPVSGDRGFVRRLDAGSYAVIEDTPATWCVSIVGRAISAQVALRDIDDDHHWQLTFRARS